MVNVGPDTVTSLFVGPMGIKEVVLNGETLHKRPGGYFYLELNTRKESE